MKNKLFLIPLAVLISLGAIHQMIFSVTPLKDVPSLMSAVRAKEFCSCFFMLNKGKNYCLKSIEKGYPLFEYDINQKDRSITFTNPLASNTARVTNDRFGCELL